MNKIKVLIAEDHKLVREGIISCLKENKNIIIVDEASNGLEAVEKAKKHKPDIILMDVAMPKMNGIEATKIICKEVPSASVLVLTAYDNEQYILKFSKCGAKGYILKNISYKDLVDAIETVYKGDLYFNKKASDTIVKDYIHKIGLEGEKKDLDLTDRELEVLTLIGEGLINKEIADKLGLSVKTINTHRENIMHKLNIHTSSGLTKYAIEKGLVKISNY